MDVAQFTSKDRKQARKNLLKKIDTYNRQARRQQQETSFPISTPSKDLVYKGIVKVTYDRGYALQTKSLLLKNTTTTREAVEQLFEALGLRGNPKDYALEERNVLTGVNRIVDGKEIPLNIQLNYGGHQNYMDLRLIQIRDTLSTPQPLPYQTVRPGSGSRDSTPAEGSGSDEDTISEGSNPNLVPKEEVIDHGVAQVELVMEEALQDIPPLVHDIQERLRGISESVAVDGKPRSGLPNRRLLWDRLKPQASALVKDIRRLVDNGEFLANKHCKNSPVVKLITTLLLELITDHSRELVTVTKEMCGLRGATKTDFDSSVSRFTQQVTYISKLVGKTTESLSSMAITGHLLVVTSPENFQTGKLTSESYFTGSKSASGVLLFVVVSAYLGLVRAAYEEKCEYYASLSTNMLRSSQRALETIQKTDEFGLLNLHPLRSRVMDMEHKLRVAMDNLIGKVKVAASSRPPPDATPEMLSSGYALIMSTLDFLMVAQCASLVHNVAIAGWELMQFPWVRAIATAGSSDGEMDAGQTRMHFADQLSSLGSDSASSHSTGGDSSVYRSVMSSPEKNMAATATATATGGGGGGGVSGERRSRIHSVFDQRESGDGMDATEMASSEQQQQQQQKVLRANYLSRFTQQYQDSEGREEEERNNLMSPDGLLIPSDTISTKSMAVSLNSTQASLKEPTIPTSPPATNTANESAHYLGIDAVRRLRRNYNINKAIARGAESLLLTLTQKINLLSSLCRTKAKDKYMTSVEFLLAASKQIREEVVSMEVDILVGEDMAELLEKNKSRVEANTRELELATIKASNSMNSEEVNASMLSAAAQLKEICSKMVAEALAKVSEHKRALEEAEKIEDEFMSLMTGQKQQPQGESERNSQPQQSRRKLSTALRNALTGESDTEGIIFKDAESGRSWAAKEMPQVAAGTVPKLIQRLTFHRVIDLEFNNTFMLTFHSFMTPEDLLRALEERFSVEPSEELTEDERERYDIEISIPIQLRVVHSLKKWFHLSYDDFKDHELSQKMDTFLATIQKSMPSCGKQLQALKELNLSSGPLHLQAKPRGVSPTPLIPISLSTGGDFDLLDVNTLELARQLTIAFSELLRDIRPQEHFSLGWTEDHKNHTSEHIVQFLQMSDNLSQLVCKEVLRETIDEDQSSVISYFIQTAKSCLDLKNFEAAFAITGGLESREVQSAVTSWQMVTEHLKGVYSELKEIISPEMDYLHYRQNLSTAMHNPCVPRLKIMLEEVVTISKEHPDTVPENIELVNFMQRRKMSKLIKLIQRFQSMPYNFHPIGIMQIYLGNLKKLLSNEELDRLSTKIESFSI